MARRTPTPGRGQSVLGNSLVRARTLGARSGARSGVTLAELLGVVVLIGLLLVVALPRLAGDPSIGSSQGDALAANLAATLRLARRLAVDNGATNASGYKVECTATSYRIRNLATAAYYGPSVPLTDGWQFQQSGYAVGFDPYGGASVPGGQSTTLTLLKGNKQWLVRVEPATGYVWCEKG